jgi:hypothetical protein
LALGTLAGLSRSPGADARAQALRPNIMVLLRYLGFDALQPANDGSPCACNNANGQTSRVYHMKNALRDALAQVGTDEANFGLMRFPQVETRTDVELSPRRLGNGGNTHVGGHEAAG